VPTGGPVPAVVLVVNVVRAVLSLPSAGVISLVTADVSASILFSRNLGVGDVSKKFPMPCSSQHAKMPERVLSLTVILPSKAPIYLALGV
jgi:hypothetical protein